MNMNKKIKAIIKTVSVAVLVAAVSFSFTSKAVAVTKTTQTNKAVEKSASVKSSTKSSKKSSSKTAKTVAVKKSAVKSSTAKADKDKTGSTKTGTSKTAAADPMSAVMNEKLLDDINALRKSKGLKALTMDSTLVSIADTRSAEASKKWSHERPNGEDGISMIDPKLWRGENLSYVLYPGYDGSDEDQDAAAEEMFDNLVASPTHYDNMVFGNFTKIGIATDITETEEGTKITTAYMFSS
ncbi:Uncharacterized conserved protein YkwD, contains CAP (CSP/antigen 5/PR1) domain [Lachnospiraceae bacterium]|nr:Uncharacterized conserved protein YkwD, contains CAP (CSP/antigen 5/PR1) domain [Lachnospiraceae bacterium]